MTAARVRTLFREGKRFRGKAITIVYRAGNDRPMGVAVVTAARWGNAVRRNRFRRVIREFLRQSPPETLPDADIVVVCRRRVSPLSEQAALSDLRVFLGETRKSRERTP